MLEPALIHACTGWPEPEIEEAICETARQIRYYEAARWTVGKVRRELPPHFKLKTRPDNLNEIALPSALRVEYVKQWAIEHVNQHHQRIVTATNSQRVEQSFDDFVMRFNDSFVSTVSNVSIEFSGKDIFAGLATWLSTRNKKGITTRVNFVPHCDLG
ncbi:MAG: hypothetical protein IPL28_23370 [Chloroflexi bacterium]|nr:hypothetical protein [Chloroflexota bacterium]